MSALTDAERSQMVWDHYANWLDFNCVCGFPHPKPGKHGPPPTLVEINGVPHIFPPYAGVMGGDEPVPVGGHR